MERQQWRQILTVTRGPVGHAAIIEVMNDHEWQQYDDENGPNKFQFTKIEGDTEAIKNVILEKFGRFVKVTVETPVKFHPLVPMDFNIGRPQ